MGGSWDKPGGYWRGAIQKSARPYLKMENNIVSPASAIEGEEGFIRDDPKFLIPDDPVSSKFQLDKESPAIKLGFKQIPFEKIGLYPSDERASWPVSK